MAFFNSLNNVFSNITNQIFGRWKRADSFDSFLPNMNEAEGIDTAVVLNFHNLKRSKTEIIKLIDEIKDFYFSQLIVNRIIDDALNTNTNDNNIFSVFVEDSNGEIDEISTKVLDDFIYKFNIESLIKDISYDLLFYGEYYLRLDVEPATSSGGGGIINIHDDVDMTKIIPIQKDGDIAYYVKQENNKLKLKSPTEYVHFIIRSERIKIKLENEILVNNDKITYVKIGKSILYPIFGVLKELQFFEQLIPIRFMQDSMKTLLVSVQVPPNTKPADAKQISQAFEKMINNTLKFKEAEKPEDFLREIQSKAGNVKVIPNWGDKGSLEAQDFTTQMNYDALFDKINDLRKYCLTTVGLPSSIIDEENLKADVIKENVRYAKKLKSFQDSLADGLKRLFIVHLHNKGFVNVMKDNIKINFLNVLNIDDLEKLEYIDLMVSMFDNFNSFVSNLKEQFDESANVDTKEYIKFINSQFKNITGFDIFIYKEEEETNETNKVIKEDNEI